MSSAALDRVELARLEHENMIEAMMTVAANVEGAIVRLADGVALFATGLPFRLFNQVLVASADARPEAIAEAAATARARGDRFVVSLRVGEDDRHVATVQALGLVPMADKPWMPGMALYPLPTANLPELAAGHEIVQATDEGGVEDHIVTAVAGFRMPESFLRAIISPALANDAKMSIYVGYTDGEGVSTGLGVRTGRTIGVYNISTIPSARGRGYGAAMTRRVAADGAAAGCDVATLQASDMGYSIYERLGYRTVVEYVGYVDPASVEHPTH